MQRADKAKLDVEGVIYKRRSLKVMPGWYMAGVWIGRNYKEALDWLYNNGY